jgi:hypothetical protein
VITARNEKESRSPSSRLFLGSDFEVITAREVVITAREKTIYNPEKKVPRIQSEVNDFFWYR